MNERLSSGHARLDEILEGGIPRGSISLVIGIPGSGKTILSQQFAFKNAQAGAPALYLSTITEPFFMSFRSDFCTSRGAFAPGINTAPTTRSACRM